MHLEKELLKGKKMSPATLKKKAKEEVEEVAENPEKEGKEAREILGKKGQKEAIEKKVSTKKCPHCGKDIEKKT